MKIQTAAQRKVLLATALAMLGALLFPPFHAFAFETVLYLPAGHHWIFEAFSDAPQGPIGVAWQTLAVIELTLLSIGLLVRYALADEN